MELDRKTAAKVKAKLRELKRDPELTRKIDKELEGLSGDELREYISNSAQLSEKEAREGDHDSRSDK